MRIQLVMRLVGQLLCVFASLMLIPFIHSLIFEETFYSFFLCSLTTFGLAAILIYYGKKGVTFSLRDGFLTVSSLWLLASFFGSFPFYLSGIIPTYEDALFESVSGITATGATMIPDVDALPKTFILWRSITNWMGGMGIIVLMLAFLKNLGADAAHLFNAEASAPRPGVVLPRIRLLATKLWTIYCIFTVFCFILLWLAGIPGFDALNLALSTVSTGGFTPHSDGTFLYKDNIYVTTILIIFMILAGGNFTVYHNIYTAGVKKSLVDFEFRMYIIFLLLGSIVVFGSLYFQSDYNWSEAIGTSLFTYISMQTGSGFAIADYDKWPEVAQMALFLSTFFGGCSGSTTGGLKIIRIIILVKSSIIYLRRSLHPDLVQLVRMNGKPVQVKWLQMAQQFFFLYLLVFAISTLLVTITGIPVGEAMQCVAGFLGDVGLAFGQFGPTDSFQNLHSLAKFVLALDMILGRLELFTLLVLLLPDFWKGYFSESKTKKKWVSVKTRNLNNI